jgi:uncharacterized protein with PIN domain/sulfur carrier protein ThiS
MTKGEQPAKPDWTGKEWGVTARVMVRCYAELNDFLPAQRRQQTFAVCTPGGRSVKDLLESVGVPHTEVDLLLVNGEPAAFDHRVADGDRVTVYPVFEAFDIAPATRVRPEPLRETRFVLDAHLGRLAALLRLAGFDAAYRSDAADDALAAVSHAERRILLTRDQALLKRRAVTHGYYVREVRPREQLVEVVRRFQLARSARPFTRCTCCNTVLAVVAKGEVADLVPPRSFTHFERFLRCGGCGRVYWRGSHYERLRTLIDEALAAAG